MKQCKWILIGMAAAILWLCPAVLTEAGETGIEMEVKYGVDGHVKYGCYFPVDVLVTNQGEDFNGNISIRIPTQDEFAYGYSSVFNMPAVNAHEISFGLDAEVAIAAGDSIRKTFSIPAVGSPGAFCVTVADDVGNILEQEWIRTNADYMNPELYIAVVSDKKPDDSFFSGVTITGYESIKIRSIVLDEAEFPETVFGLDLLDLVILDGTSVELTSKQKEALFSWQANGGIVDVRTMAGIRDPEEYLLKILGAEKLTYQAEQMHVSMSENYYQVEHVLSGVVDQVPNFWLYALLVCGYVILAGPVIYLILKHQKKREYLWMCTGVLALLTTMLIWFLSMSTRFQAPFINYVNYIYLEDGMVNDRTYFNLRAPSSNPFYMYTDSEYDLALFTNQGYYNDKNTPDISDFEVNVQIRYGELENKISIQNLPSFTNQYFVLDQSYALQGEQKFTVSANLFKDQADVTITNDLGYDIEDAVLLYYGRILHIGDLKKGETVQLREQEVLRYNTIYSYEMGEAVFSGKENDNETALRMRILQSYIDLAFSENSGRCILTGFAADPEQTEFQLDTAYDIYGTSFLTMQVDADFEKDGYFYRYCLEQNAEVTSGEYMLYNYNIAYSDEVIYTIDLGRDVEDITLFAEIEAVVGEEVWYLKTFSGNAWFYNHRTGDFDGVDILKGEFKYSELKDYLGEENQLTIRYEMNQQGFDEGIILPTLSMTGRKADAGN